MIHLTSEDRRHLKALAHDLKPVVMIGQHGLSEAVLREIAVNLDAHELIKVRVQGSDKAAREAILNTICEELNACAVQHIGKLLVIWREGKTPKIIPPSLAKLRR